MLKKIIFIIGIITVTTVAIVHALDNEKRTPQYDNLPGLAIGEKAPDFTLENLQGDSVRLSDFRGKTVMLNFWATWCPPCKAEMPDMEKFHKEAGEKVVILAVNMDTYNDVQGFAEEIGVSFPILLDNKNEVNKAYKILAIPTTYFIDKEGYIKHKFMKQMPIEIMREFTKE
ncbi:TlpA family protein disulfide reductase [Bacillaceae bacterium Marseille-Q3522]|nr:TlpA family protein disulfide reductase [Bacillaceae bacterium Marseille-Q3522]